MEWVWHQQVARLSALLVIVMALIGCASYQLNRGYERGKKDYHSSTVHAFASGWVLGFADEHQKAEKVKKILGSR